jgi:hypothetical protein
LGIGAFGADVSHRVMMAWAWPSVAMGDDLVTPCADQPARPAACGRPAGRPRCRLKGVRDRHVQRRRQGPLPPVLMSRLSAGPAPPVLPAPTLAEGTVIGVEQHGISARRTDGFRCHPWF